MPGGRRGPRGTVEKRPVGVCRLSQSPRPAVSRASSGLPSGLAVDTVGLGPVRKEGPLLAEAGGCLDVRLPLDEP